MASNKIFEKIPHVIPNRSGFVLSHECIGSAKVGNLVPVFTREMMGKDSLSVNLGQQIQFPPFATDFYGRIKCYFEAFFVPYRIIDGAYKEMYKRAVNPDQNSSQADYYGVNPYWRGLTYTPTGTTSNRLGPGSLLDYLGFKVASGGADVLGNTIYFNNMNRLLAYHTIYDEYYRDSRISRSAFSLIQNASSVSLNDSQKLSTVWSSSARWNSGNQNFLAATVFEDGHHIFDLRSRMYAKDYFTTATVKPQFGNEMNVTPDSNGNISVSQIRAAVALQQYVEIYNRTSTHYDDIAFALTGIRPSDAAVDIPVYLGRLVYDVYNKSVFQTNGQSENGYTGDVDGQPLYTAAQNPFASAASKYANGQSLGSGHLCDFTATEGGIFMILMSVAPMAVYSSGVNRAWYYSSLLDMPQPQLAGIGDQPIYTGEITEYPFVAGSAQNSLILDEDSIFGYSQRFAEAKFMLDEVHGLLREYESLSAFALKRHFQGGSLAPEISTDFLTIKENSLDEVASIAGSVSQFGYWYDLYFETKLVSNLPAYSLPTLENMKGDTVMIDNGGRRL